jgi:hypothetical protein
MRPLRLTIFVLLLMAFGGQIVRHSYVRWFEPRASVLDKYESKAATEAKGARTLQELDKLYADAIAKEKAEQEALEADPPRADKPRRFRPEERMASFELKSAIQEWEGRQKDLRELRFFFGAGVVALILGFVCERLRLAWGAVAFAALAFVEMLWWTTVSWHSGLWREYDRLLDNKLALTAAAIALLLLARWRGPLSTKDGPGQ